MRRTTDTKAAGRGVARYLAMAMLSLFAAPVLDRMDPDKVRAHRRRYRASRRDRKRSLLSSRLGAFDPRPTSGGRNAEWKKLHAESMQHADRLREGTGKPDPRFIYDENFRNVGIEFAR